VDEIAGCSDLICRQKEGHPGLPALRGQPLQTGKRRIVENGQKPRFLALFAGFLAKNGRF
jgi:hypothetical protein